jgi:hypothetical protein
MIVATLHFVSQAKQEGQAVVITSWVELLTVVSIIALLVSAILTGIRYWQATECHVVGCHKHQWKKVAGTDHVVCKKHHPDDEPTHDDVLAAHTAARRNAARRL